MSFFTPPPIRPSPTRPATFRPEAIAFYEWTGTTMISEMETLNTNVTNAAAALTLNSTNDTSASSVLIGTGSKSFTVSASKSFSPGMWLSIADTAAPTTNSMVAQVTSYSGTALVVNVPANGIRGSGTKTAWVITLTAAPSTDVAATFLPVSSAANLPASRTALEVSSTTEMNTAIAAATAPLGGFRNVVMNGNMAISQEFGTASTTVTAGAALKYVVDGWYAACTGANVTVQQVVTSNKASLVVTGLAANTGVTLGHRIESLDSYSMAGLFATLSLLVSSNTLTTVNWGLYYANTKDAFGTFAVPTRTLIQTGSFTGVTSTAALKSAITSAALSTSAHTGLEIVISVPSLLGAQTLTITDVQLEKGSITNPIFDNLEAPRQLLRCCRRYFERHLVARGTATAAANVADSQVHFPVPMLAAPTITNKTAGLVANVSSENFSNVTPHGVRYGVVSTAAGDFYRVDRLFSFSAPL